MKTAGKHLLIFEGARARQYPQRSCASEHNHKNWAKWFQPSLVAVILDEGSKACGFVEWCGSLLARPLLRIRYGLPATLSMRFNQLFLRFL